MFGRSMFDDDPFFADHRNMVDSMMRGFGGFGGGFGAIEGDGERWPYSGDELSLWRMKAQYRVFYPSN